MSKLGYIWRKGQRNPIYDLTETSWLKEWEKLQAGDLIGFGLGVVVSRARGRSWLVHALDASVAFAHAGRPRTRARRSWIGQDICSETSCTGWTKTGARHQALLCASRSAVGDALMSVTKCRNICSRVIKHKTRNYGAR